MVSQRAREIIERDMPGVKIVEDEDMNQRPMPEGVVSSPSAQALINKWGGRQPESLDDAEEEAGVVMVQVERLVADPSKVTASLQRRILIVDEKSGKIIGENG